MSGIRIAPALTPPMIIHFLFVVFGSSSTSISFGEYNLERASSASRLKVAVGSGEGTISSASTRAVMPTASGTALVARLTPSPSETRLDDAELVAAGLDKT